jgi:periplasmic divalent cation tolerance protein
MTEFVVVLTTLPVDALDAAAFARTLVEERLAACVNIHAPALSVYRWQEGIEEATERLLTIKTTTGKVAALRERIHALHPYDVPEFLVLPVSAGSDAYLDWVRSST